MNLPSLKTLTLPGSIEKIQNHAIRNVGVEILDLSNLSYPTLESYTIRDCDKLETLLLPTSIDKLPQRTVINCKKLTNVIIGENTKSISKNVFENVAVTEITIPSGVTMIESGAFAKMDRLAAIWVDDENPRYCDVDGVLYTHSMDTVHTYPIARPGSSYILPTSVSTIGSYAFIDNQKLSTLYVTGNLMCMESHSLYRLPLLSALYFWEGLPVIWENNAVNQCEQLVLYCPEEENGGIDGEWTAPDGTVFQVKIHEFGK